jgi:hypothetical protein
MKTLFVVCPRNVNRHAGEIYDAILEVSDQPTTEDIQDWANRIRDSIRGLWEEQVGGIKDDPDKTLVTKEPIGVVVTLDAANPYHAVLANLQIIMKAEEGTVVELPYAKPKEAPRDPETLDMLKRLGENV